MRGIAKGQTIELFIIPEVKQMVTQFCGAARFGPLTDQQLLAGVSAWLVVNAMKSETTQSNILIEQLEKKTERPRGKSRQ
jgi:hypothetical protein